MGWYFKEKSTFVVFAFICIQITTAQVTPTVSTESAFETTSTLPLTSVSNEVLPTERNPKISKEELPVFGVHSFNLTDDTLKLFIYPSESSMEFRISVDRKSNSSTNSSNLALNKAKRLMVAFENEHFNVDVISLPITSDSAGNIAFGNLIEDFSWNKKNGIMLRDSIQNYRWISSGAKENGSEFFVTFTRDWLTCDEQDIQFALSNLKIWWLIDSQNSTTLSLSKKASHKMFEKQEAAPESSTVVPTTPEPQLSTKTIDISTQATKVTTIQQSNDSTTTRTKPAAIEKVGSAKPPLVHPTSTVSSKEVEILKSISDYKFQGPLNMSLVSTFQKASFVYLKTCQESQSVFHCNTTTLNPQITNTSSFLHIWQIGNLNQSTSHTKKPEFQIQPCSKINDLIKVHHASNKRIYNAFSGSRTPKSHNQSKNSGEKLYILTRSYTIMFPYLTLIKTISGL